jgi:hypothetical protein
MLTRQNNLKISPPVGMERFAVLRFLYANRGRRGGWMKEDLANRLNVHMKQVERELISIIMLLNDDTSNDWYLNCWSEQDEYQVQQNYYMLAHPLCPRPGERKILEDYEPELISLEDLKNEVAFEEVP